ncbi:MAG: acyl-ACP--UDP-N-acetylglucosamine O-acyltransferase [Dictyoglomaceae bacterium]|nr:acyl-ACP--UDP-N-acetylglucosamine O-acyltransferase [Dictyoglomaceae bacterium]
MPWDNNYKNTIFIHPSSEIGENVEIGPFTFIDKGVRIGNNTKIENNVVLKEGTIIGENCHIHSGVILGDLPQDLNFKGEKSFLIIGNNVVIREYCVIHRASGEGNATIIRDDCYIMAYAHLAHNVKLGKKVIIANGAQIGGYVEIDDQAFISGLVGIHQFVRIGKLAMIGGLTKVVKDVPPYALVDGNPARVYGINTVGLKRANFSLHKRNLIKKFFHILYSNLSFEERIKKISEFEEEEAKEILEFIKNSKRGITSAVWRRIEE